MFDHRGVEIVVSTAERVGAGVLVFDSNDRTVYSNGRNAELYPFFDFSEGPTYSDLFWKCVEHQMYVEPEVYSDPRQRLHQLLGFRRSNRFAQFLKRYRNGRVYFVCHEQIPEFGSYLARIDVTDAVGSQFDSPSMMFGPLAWTGGLPVSAVGSVGRVTLLQGTLEAIPSAVAIVDAAGKLIDMNRSMADLLEEADGLELSLTGNLQAAEPRESAELRKKISRYAKTRIGPSNAVMRITRPGSVHPYIVSVSSTLPEIGSAVTGGQNAALVKVVDSAAEPLVPANILGELYGLTPAESRVAVEIGAGRRVEEVATMTGTSQATVRVHLRSIFSKAKISKQSDLVRLMMNIASIVKPKSRR